jgi:hypothetical protein
LTGVIEKQGNLYYPSGLSGSQWVAYNADKYEYTGDLRAVLFIMGEWLRISLLYDGNGFSGDSTAPVVNQGGNEIGLYGADIDTSAKTVQLKIMIYDNSSFTSSAYKLLLIYS